MEILAYIIFLIIFILWQIFPNIFLWVYMACISLFLFFTVIPIFTIRKYIEPFKDAILKRLTEQEFEYLKKNALYYIYPFGARSFSATCSFLQISGIIFGIIFLIRGLWGHAIISGINYIIFGPIAAYLNKPFFLHEALQQGNVDPAIISEAQITKQLSRFMQTEWPTIAKETRRLKKKKD